MKKLLLVFAIWTITVNVIAQIPANYYNNAGGKSCATLKTALKSIVTPGNYQTYNSLWAQYQVSDVKPRTVGTGSANVIWDIYSTRPNGTDPYQFTPGTTSIGGQQDPGTGGGSEGQYYNREHSVPQSWFNGNASSGIIGPESDYHHVFPTDKKVNSLRGNFIYGEVASATTTTLNGGKLGSSSFAGLTGTVFEPIDSFKGDVARAFLYFVTRYEDNMSAYATNTEALQAFEPNTFPSIDIAYLKLMLKWHNLDPVSQKEINRNNAAYTFQANRNPYVDHPEYVAQVWNGTCPGLSVLPVNVIYFSGKLQGNKIALTWEVENEINFAKYEVERSFNGTSYNLIGTITATGSKVYTYSDDASTINGRRVYYRLKKVDKDGSFTYSEVFSIHIPLNVKFSVYPNPAASFIQLQVNTNTRDAVQVTVSDLTGKQLISNSYQVNNGLIKISTANLTNGTYLVKLVSGGEQYLQKVVVAK